jgi:hypothetical protein
MKLRSYASVWSTKFTLTLCLLTCAVQSVFVHSTVCVCVQYSLCLSALRLVHTDMLQWQSRTFRAHPTVLYISSLLQLRIMAIRNFGFSILSTWRWWKFDLIHFISPEITRWWYLASVNCSEIWLSYLCPAKYLGTCSRVGPVWLPCIFRANCYYYAFTLAWLNKQTVSCFARSYAPPDICRSVKFPHCTVPDNKVSGLWKWKLILNFIYNLKTYINSYSDINL